MGTRSDFYIGRTDMEWLGSTAMDGYPDGIPPEVLNATDEDTYRRVVQDWLLSDDYGTLPEMGWPWPWEDSNASSFAYAFENGKVWCWSYCWFDPLVEFDLDAELESGRVSDDATHPFPNMKAIQNVTMGQRSGLLVISSRGIENVP